MPIDESLPNVNVLCASYRRELPFYVQDAFNDRTVRRLRPKLANLVHQIQPQTNRGRRLRWHVNGNSTQQQAATAHRGRRPQWRMSGKHCPMTTFVLHNPISNVCPQSGGAFRLALFAIIDISMNNLPPTVDAAVMVVTCAAYTMVSAGARYSTTGASAAHANVTVGAGATCSTTGRAGHIHNNWRIIEDWWMPRILQAEALRSRSPSTMSASATWRRGASAQTLRRFVDELQLWNFDGFLHCLDNRHLHKELPRRLQNDEHIHNVGAVAFACHDRGTMPSICIPPPGPQRYPALQRGGLSELPKAHRGYVHR